MKTNLVAVYHHPCMQPLHQSISLQDHRTLVLWALETGKETLEVFSETFPEDQRPAMALAAADSWSRGQIKMPVAKRTARETHLAAKDAKTAKGKLVVDGSPISDARINAAVAAAHAMGQVIGVVHVATHSTAYAAYVVQAAVLLHSDKDPETSLAEMVDHLMERLMYWASVDKSDRTWATFL